jgi:hypothetical protein
VDPHITPRLQAGLCRRWHAKLLAIICASSSRRLCLPASPTGREQPARETWALFALQRNYSIIELLGLSATSVSMLSMSALRGEAYIADPRCSRLQLIELAGTSLVTLNYSGRVLSLKNMSASAPGCPNHFTYER